MNTTTRKHLSAAGVQLTGLLLITSALILTRPAQADNSRLNPTADYSPDQVVQIVIDALKNNNVTANDDGIATVFRFASPGNRASTGPLSRFTSMIKRGFSDMLTHTSARFDPMEISENKAIQAVWLQQPGGEELGYAFQLGKQTSGQYQGIWMTEAVIPLGKGKQSGTRI